MSRKGGLDVGIWNVGDMGSEYVIPNVVTWVKGTVCKKRINDTLQSRDWGHVSSRVIASEASSIY